MTQRASPSILALAILLLGCGCAHWRPPDDAGGEPAGQRTASVRLPEDPAWFADSPFRDVVRAAARSVAAKADRTKGNYVRILDHGDDALLARIHLIRQARRSICVQTFIWTNDEVGRFVMHELIEAAKRGVQVRVIADHFVSDKDPEVVAFLATAHPNMRIRHYRPASGRIRPSSLRVLGTMLVGFRGFNQRMHNKIMLFDDIAVITGGRNIENSYYNRSTGMNFRDRDVLVVGPAVLAARASFDCFWKYRHSVPSEKLLDVVPVIRSGAFRRFGTRDDFAFDSLCRNEDRDASDARVVRARLLAGLVRAERVEFVADKPGKNRAVRLSGGGRLTRRLVDTLETAESEILMQSPYFVLRLPDRRFLARLRRRSPGLRIVVSSNSFGSTDNVMAYSANYRLRSSYIEGLDIDIHEYKPHPAELRVLFPAYDAFAEEGERRMREGMQSRGPFLCVHAKSLVIDGHLAYVGSYNIDPRSANLNTEVGFLIDDPAVARQLRASILRDCLPENSWVIAKRQMPLSVDRLNSLVEGLMLLSPIDLWPIRNTTSFDLRPGKPPVPRDHPDFYANYEDCGAFPGADSWFSMKEITTRILKTVGPMGVSLL